MGTQKLHDNKFQQCLTSSQGTKTLSKTLFMVRGHKGLSPYILGLCHMINLPQVTNQAQMYENTDIVYRLHTKFDFRSCFDEGCVCERNIEIDNTHTSTIHSGKGEMRCLTNVCEELLK